MKRKIVSFVALALAFFTGGETYAVNGDRSAASQPQVIEAEKPEVAEATSMKTQRFAIGPQLGVVTYTDNLGDTSSRGTVGLNLDWNLAKNLGASPDLYVGFQTGAQIAKVGGADANFFGGDSSPGTGLDDATLVTAPVNAKIGYNISDKSRLSVHGGGNVIYRSSAGAVRLADDDPAATESAWDMYPNVGADLEFQVGKNVGILARPDFTFTGDENLFIGTLAANLMF